MAQDYIVYSEAVIRLLNAALATELVAVLRYKHQFCMTSGRDSNLIKAAFLAHATEEMIHADRLAKRIMELGGTPDFSPEGLSSRSHAPYAKSTQLNAMLEENIAAGELAMLYYQETIDYLGDNDPTTQQMLKQILAGEKEHTASLSLLLQSRKLVSKKIKKNHSASHPSF